ncbi:hypothetical protein Tco_0516072 [Tanacetum coccineum]
MYEVSNGNLVGGKYKHIISTLEFAREYPMKRIVNVNRLIEICDGPLIPTATNILKANSNEANKYIVHGVEMSFNKLVVHGVINVWEHKTVTCDKFHNKGHNSRSYTGPRVPKSKKRKVASKVVDLDIDGPTSSQSKKISSGDGPTCSQSKKGSSEDEGIVAVREAKAKSQEIHALRVTVHICLLKLRNKDEHGSGTGTDGSENRILRKKGDGVADDDYKEDPVFDDDQYEDVIEEEE